MNRDELTLLDLARPLAEMTGRQREAYLDTQLCGDDLAVVAARMGITRSGAKRLVEAARMRMDRYRRKHWR